MLKSVLITLFAITVLIVFLGNIYPVLGQRGNIKKLIDKFDEDGDGRLSISERDAARKFLEKFKGAGTSKEISQKLFPDKADLYKFKQGPYKFDVVENFELKTTARNKTLPLRITFPQENKAFPLIVWCHGAMGSKDGNGPLVEHWVSHGYVVIQPTFGDSISLMTPEEKKKVKSILQLVNSPRVTGQWDDRPKDVSYVIDSLNLLEEKVPGLKGKIDHQQLAIAGHSFGAHTTMMLSGMKLIIPLIKKPISFADDRFQAALMISPQGPTTTITEKSYTEMNLPFLMITGDNDGSPMRGQEEKKGTWRKLAFDHSPTGDKYLLWVKEAYHSFGGITGGDRNPGTGPISVDQVSVVKSTALAFFDAYLKENQQARKYLNSSQLEKESDGLGRITTK